MKERPIFRNFLVCYDDWRCISWLTETEFQQMMLENKVTWFSKQGDKKPTYVNGTPAFIGGGRLHNENSSTEGSK